MATRRPDPSDRRSIVAALVAGASLGVAVVRAEPDAPSLPADRGRASCSRPRSRRWRVRSRSPATSTTHARPRAPADPGRPRRRRAAGSRRRPRDRHPALQGLALARRRCAIAHVTAVRGAGPGRRTSDEAWCWDSNGHDRAMHVWTWRRRPGAAATRPPAPDDAAAPRDADLTRWRRAIARSARARRRTRDVSVDGTASVAGRPVYELVLTPTSALTLVGRDRASRSTPRRGCRCGSQVFARRERTTPRSRPGSPPCRSTRSIRRCSRSRRLPGATVRQVAPTVVAMARHPRGCPGRRSPVGDRSARVRHRVRAAGRDPARRRRCPTQARALLPYAGPLLSAIAVERGRTAPGCWSGPCRVDDARSGTPTALP